MCPHMCEIFKDQFKGSDLVVRIGVGIKFRLG